MSVVTLVKYQDKQILNEELINETRTIQIQSVSEAILASSLYFAGSGRATITFYQQTNDKSDERTILAIRKLSKQENSAKQNILTSIHKKVFCEIVVFGTVSLAISLRAIDQIAIDSGQVYQGENFDPEKDTAILMAGLDENNKTEFISLEDKYLKVVEKNSVINHDELILELRRTREAMLEIAMLTNDIKIKSADGNANFANVSNLKALKVNNQNIPDKNDPITQVPITGYFLNNGSFDARVAGSLATPIDFTIEARDDGDIFINALQFSIADQGATLNDFGSLSQLTNGIQLIYSNIQLGEIILADDLQTNYDLVRLCQGNPAFSQGVESFRATNVDGQSEGYLPVLKLDSFGLAFGVRIRARTEDKFILRIRDDITGVDAFNVFYYGNRLL